MSSNLLTKELITHALTLYDTETQFEISGVNGFIHNGDVFIHGCQFGTDREFIGRVIHIESDHRKELGYFECHLIQDGHLGEVRLVREGMQSIGVYQLNREIHFSYIPYGPVWNLENEYQSSHLTELFVDFGVKLLSVHDWMNHHPKSNLIDEELLRYIDYNNLTIYRARYNSADGCVSLGNYGGSIPIDELISAIHTRNEPGLLGGPCYPSSVECRNRLIHKVDVVNILSRLGLNLEISSPRSWNHGCSHEDPEDICLPITEALRSSLLETVRELGNLTNITNTDDSGYEIIDPW